MKKPGIHPKHAFWIEQFKTGLPVWVANQFIQQQSLHIVERLEQEGIDAFLQYAGGTYAKDKLGQWAMEKLGFVQEILESLRQSPSRVERDLFQELQGTGSMSAVTILHSALAARLAQALGEFIPTTAWWKINIKYVRSECSKHNIVKGIMES